MFTGLIEEIGTVSKAEKRNTALDLRINCSKIISDIFIDASISVNGCCLTVTDYDETSFSATAIEETLNKTNLQTLQPGTKVNLERALQAGARLGGHNVQGHIDTTIELIDIRDEGIGKSLFYLVPPHFNNLIIDRGSICIDGISLTIAEISNDRLKLAIIPHTWENTIISEYSIGYKANVEFDIAAKQFKKMIQPYLDKLKNNN